MKRASRHKEADWNVSQLRDLGCEEREAFLDLPRAWMERRFWRPGPSCDLHRIWRYCDSHGIGGMLGNLAMSNLAEAGPMQEVLEKRYLSNSLHHERSMQVCGAIARIARTRAIPVLLLKGPALIAQAYGDSGVRGYGDFDLFTHSRAQARELIDAFSPGGETTEEYRSFLKRMQNPGKIHLVFEGRSLEISYPVAPYVDSLQDYLYANGDRAFRVAEGADALLNPDPSLHFVYLILHMATNHFCARYIWFLDLVVLAKAKRKELDLSRIAGDLEGHEMLATASRISSYCREYLDPDFPVIESRRRGLHHAFQQKMLGQETLVESRMSLHHNSFWHRLHVYAAYSTTFYLLGDLPSTRLALPWTATKRSTARFLYGLRLRGRVLHRVMEVLVLLTMFPFSRLVAWSFSGTPNRVGS